MLKLPICLASVLTIILIADQSKALVDVQEKADSSFHGCMDLNPRICEMIVSRCDEVRNIAFLYMNCRRTCSLC